MGTDYVLALQCSVPIPVTLLAVAFVFFCAVLLSHVLFLGQPAILVVAVRAAALKDSLPQILSPLHFLLHYACRCPRQSPPTC
jgi:hypothetical protein